MWDETRWGVMLVAAVGHMTWLYAKVVSVRERDAAMDLV